MDWVTDCIVRVKGSISSSYKVKSMKYDMLIQRFTQVDQLKIVMKMSVFVTRFTNADCKNVVMKERIDRLLEDLEFNNPIDENVFIVCKDSTILYNELGIFYCQHIDHKENTNNE